MRLRVEKVIASMYRTSTRFKIYARCQKTNEVYKAVIDHTINEKPEVGQLWQSVGEWEGYQILGYLIEPDQYKSVRLYYKDRLTWDRIQPGDILRWDEETIATKIDHYTVYLPSISKRHIVGAGIYDQNSEAGDLKLFEVLTPELIDDEEF